MAAAHIADPVDSVVPTINKLVELESEIILWWSFVEVVHLPSLMKKHRIAKLTTFRINFENGGNHPKCICKCSLPHEVCQVTRRDVALASPVKSLESSVGLKGLRFAEVLATELSALLALACVGEEFGELFLGPDGHVLALHQHVIVCSLQMK